jgi:hypothetical protein
MSVLMVLQNIFPTSFDYEYLDADNQCGDTLDISCLTLYFFFDIRWI